MRGSLTKLIATAVFIPTLILMGISGYFLYQNFNKYNEVKKSSQYLKLAKKLENLLVALGQERGVSSIYAVSKGEYPNSKKLLAKKRANFSKAVQELKDFIAKNPQFKDKVAVVLNKLNKLPQVRKEIDSFNKEYIKTYFFTYYTDLETEIMKTQAEIFKYFPEEIKKTYELKFPFEKIIAYSGIIRGFGSYFITADIPMSEEEYQNVLLKYYHDTNILPIELLAKNLQKDFTSEEFKKIESDSKAALFFIEQANMEYYLTGQFNGYPIDALDYFNLFTKRIQYFSNVVKHLNEKINTQLETIISKANQNLMINAIVQIIALIMLILGFYIVRLIKEHIDELSHLMTSLTPVLGKKTEIDISSTQGINEAIRVVDEALKVIQESVRKAEEATKAKSLFLANMSHEIRTPLNGILGFLELLKTTELNEEQEEYVNTISQSAKNLLQIVNNILDVSKIESNKVTLEVIDFKFVDEIENTIEIFATPAAQKKIEFVADISPNLPTVVKGDVLKIKEILTNLINNAIKFTHEQGTISVQIKLEKLENKKATVYFEVKDTGIGMSEEQKAKIFEAFAQADESVTRKYGGTGLGLTIVKSYIEMMGGNIEVESEINKGTKFFFTLTFDVVDETPKYKEKLLQNTTVAILNTQRETLRKEFMLNYFNYFGISKIGINNKSELDSALNNGAKALVVFYEESDKSKIEELKDTNIPIITISSYAYKENVDALNPEATIFDPTLPSKVVNAFSALKEKKSTKKVKIVEKPIYKLKVLIAEDNPINMKLLTTTLKSLGVEADTAQNGLEAFNKYTMHPDRYDLIFMDMQMPVMDGLEATQEIREFEKEEELPHIPIIAVTANALKGDREKCLGVGMDDYISKPIKKEELLRVLEDVAKNKYGNIIEENNDKIVVATESEFLGSHFKKLLDNIEVVSNLNELSTALSNATILIIEEDFENSDIDELINSIKSQKDIKIIVIGEKEHPNADGIITEINDDEIKNIINSIRG